MTGRTLGSDSKSERKREKGGRTFASTSNLSNVSEHHFSFILSLGNNSQLILTLPSPPSWFSLKDGVHRGPARSLNLCSASGVERGRDETGTETVTFREAGWDSPW